MNYFGEELYGIFQLSTDAECYHELEYRHVAHKKVMHTKCGFFSGHYEFNPYDVETIKNSSIEFRPCKRCFPDGHTLE